MSAHAHAVCRHYDTAYIRRACTLCGEPLLVCPRCVGPGRVICDECEQTLDALAARNITFTADSGPSQKPEKPQTQRKTPL